MPECYSMKHGGQCPSSHLVALQPEASDPPTAGFVVLIQRAGHVSLVPSDAWSITRVENQHLGPETAHSVEATECRTELKEIDCILFRSDQPFEMKLLHNTAPSAWFSQAESASHLCCKRRVHTRLARVHTTHTHEHTQSTHAHLHVSASACVHVHAHVT